MNDPYATIGVGRDAPLDAVRAAYRERIREAARERFDGATEADRLGAATRLGDLADAMAAAWAERGDEASGTGQLGAIELPVTHGARNGDGDLRRALDATLGPRRPPSAETGVEEPAAPHRPGRFEAAAAAQLERPAAPSRRSPARSVLAVGALGALAVAAVAYALVGRGSDHPPERTFAARGAPFTFAYPAAWPVRGVPRVSSALNRPTYQASVGPDREDVLIVSTYRLAATVNADGSATSRAGRVSRRAWWGEVDTRIAQVGKAAGMRADGPPRDTELGPLPGRAYAFSKPDGSLASTFVVAFQGRTQFFVNCQSRPARADDVSSACDRLQATFVPRSAG